MTPATLAQAIAQEMGISAHEPMTPEQSAEFRERLEAAMTFRSGKPEGISPSPLTPDEIRQLLRECVTVVKPGETLVIRGDRNWTPNQVREVQDWLDSAAEWRDLGFKILVVPGDEFGIAEPPAAPFPGGPYVPIAPVPLDEPAEPVTEPRRFQYHVGGPCGTPEPDGTCGCASARAAAGGFLKECREDTFRHERVESVRLTHLPTGIVAEAPTRDEAISKLGQVLLSRGDISVNDARAAYGLRPFPDGTEPQP